MAGYLVARGSTANHWATLIARSSEPVTKFAGALQEERRAALLQIAGYAPADIQQIRMDFDTSLRATAASGDALRDIDRQAVDDVTAKMRKLGGSLADIRAAIDSGLLSMDDAYSFYNEFFDATSAGLDVLFRYAPDPATTADISTTSGVYNAAEGMARSSALAIAATISGGLSLPQRKEYSRQIGYYRLELDRMSDHLSAPERLRLRSLLTSEDWQNLNSAEDALIAGTPVVLDPVDWQNAATEVSKELLQLARAHFDAAHESAAANGWRIARNSMLTGIAALIMTVAAILTAVRLSSSLVNQLKRLRRDTLSMADDRLPEIMANLRAGHPMNLETELTPLQGYGRDEIGQVADAFNKAQLAAIQAATTEAQTREGVKAVFLNIAHRSQLIVHRQLELLDKAEFNQQDPAIVDMLFKLDHLATRARRNAENLIILGGEQPGRRWRNPVPLTDLVRSAVAETKEYTRVDVHSLPAVAIIGSAVADLIHLLAELLDNGTSFAPPEAKVSVSGNVVGKGIALEIVDQGLGMSETDIRGANEALQRPPDFDLTTLSSDSRVGLFVVAKLAARHGIGVRLTESVYGGIRAVVLIPSGLTSNESGRSIEQPHAGMADFQSESGSSRVRGPEPDAREAAPLPYVPKGHVEAGLRSSPETTRELCRNSGLNRQSGQESFGDDAHTVADDHVPPLPQRHRKSLREPQRVRPYAANHDADDAVWPMRSADQARDLFSAIEDGTKRGRVSLSARRHLEVDTGRIEG
ncbi:sensor histidine kinase [Nocardia sp. CY41]|uniref:sensor histidine kinase n=1 Tax=Nocardia sp. CY41 TaxID=2608686 RepID=UPI0013582F75|nr:nitrate- and nitrite sensing domain-containing protein [Nocardia sp. CY41]